MLENVNHHKTSCIDIANLQRGDNNNEGVYGNGEANITRDLTKPSLNKINMEFITSMHTRDLRDIENVGTVIMGGCVEGNSVVASQSAGDSQPSTNIKGCRGELTAVTSC